MIYEIIFMFLTSRLQKNGKLSFTLLHQFILWVLYSMAFLHLVKGRNGLKKQTVLHYVKMITLMHRQRICHLVQGLVNNEIYPLLLSALFQLPTLFLQAIFLLICSYIMTFRNSFYQIHDLIAL